MREGEREVTVEERPPCNLFRWDRGTGGAHGAMAGRWLADISENEVSAFPAISLEALGVGCADRGRVFRVRRRARRRQWYEQRPLDTTGDSQKAVERDTRRAYWDQLWSNGQNRFEQHALVWHLFFYHFTSNKRSNVLIGPSSASCFSFCPISGIATRPSK